MVNAVLYMNEKIPKMIGIMISIMRCVFLPRPSAVCSSFCALLLLEMMNCDRNIVPMETMIMMK